MQASEREALVKDLFDFTGMELHEAAWGANLPLHPSAALDSFFEAFRNHGRIPVNLNDKQRIANFSLALHKGKIEHILRTGITYDNILRGWQSSFPASPRSLYDSIYQVYDQLGEQIRHRDRHLFESEELGWERQIRGKEPREIRELMESWFLSYFTRYHEGILVPYNNGEKSSREFQNPKIFWKVLQDYPIHLLHRAVVSNEVYHDYEEDGLRLTPNEEYVLDIPEEEFDENYHPSESVMMGVFWGMYLNALSKEKGYPAIYEDENTLRNFIVRGNRGLDPLYARRTT